MSTLSSRVDADEAPRPGTLQRWCWDLVVTTDLTAKLDPEPVPDPQLEASWEEANVLRRPSPGRPPALRLSQRSARTPRPGALADPGMRARLLHTFLHHELQAAELFAWAVLAFPETPRAFRAGLLRLCGEELSHLELYRRHLEELDVNYGDFSVRDWFWERVGSCPDAVSFVALLGIGLEGANLEHSARFAAAFRAAGDERGARILERVEHEEIAHVAFALHWFERWSGGRDYERWAAALPAPLTPAVLHGRPLNRSARLRAGMDEEFLACLEAEPPTTKRRPADAQKDEWIES